MSIYNQLKGKQVNYTHYSTAEAKQNLYVYFQKNHFFLLHLTRLDKVFDFVTDFIRALKIKNFTHNLQLAMEQKCCFNMNKGSNCEKISGKENKFKRFNVKIESIERISEEV